MSVGHDKLLPSPNHDDGENVAATTEVSEATTEQLMISQEPDCVSPTEGEKIDEKQQETHRVGPDSGSSDECCAHEQTELTSKAMEKTPETLLDPDKVSDEPCRSAHQENNSMHVENHPPAEAADGPENGANRPDEPHQNKSTDSRDEVMVENERKDDDSLSIKDEKCEPNNGENASTVETTKSKSLVEGLCTASQEVKDESDSVVTIVSEKIWETRDEDSSSQIYEELSEDGDGSGYGDESEDGDDISDDGSDQTVDGLNDTLEDEGADFPPVKSVTFDIADNKHEEVPLDNLHICHVSEPSTEEMNSTDVPQSSCGSGDLRDQTNGTLARPDRSNDNDCSKRYTRFISNQHKPILFVLQRFSRFSAQNPVLTVAVVIFLSLFLLIVGYTTNFRLEVAELQLWAPHGSLSYQHALTKGDLPGFKEAGGSFFMVFHAQGENVLDVEKLSRVFSTLDLVRSIPSYEETCNSLGPDDYPCLIYGVTNYWNNSASVFRDEVNSTEKLRKDLSLPLFPDGVPASPDYLMGYIERDATNRTIVSAQSVYVTLMHPTIAGNWEIEAETGILALRDRWANEEGNSLRLEVQSSGSVSREFTRAIEKDIPLVPAIFIVMSIFTALVFIKRDAVRSRGSLGFAAVVAVLLSLASGFGLAFLCGVPYTSITQLLPFLIFGIGLDDAFIVMGAYERTDESSDPVDRIAETIDDIGLSITLTSLTSATAFAIGCVSSVPAVFWLCLYSVPTIVIVYLYQLTFFVACIVLDERRIAARRRDCLLCLQVNAEKAYETEHIATRIMGWYAERLLNPVAKVIVVVVFISLFGLCSWSASQLTQEFDFRDVLPNDSYLGDISDALELYRERGALEVQVIFHSVDFSAPETRILMRKYLADLIATEVCVKPNQFWLEHFEIFVGFGGHLELPFNEQIDLFLQHPTFGPMYFDDIVHDDEGNVVATRTLMPFKVDLNDVNKIIESLKVQQEVTKAQLVNREAVETGSPYYRFFLLDALFPIWEFFAVAVHELMLTTVVSIIAVTFVAFIFIPHWSAAVFVLPLTCILYVDLLGVLQWGGVHINPMSYVCLAMSIGLVVDFIIHVLFRYYECQGTRREKTVEMLKTMGASVLLGGLTTFLGTVPLILSSSIVFYTVFLTFLGIVTLGMGHGLIFLPVLLATFGPQESISVRESTKEQAKHDLSCSTTCQETDYMPQVNVDTGLIYL